MTDLHSMHDVLVDTNARYVNRFLYSPFILRRHFKENSRMTFQTEINKKF